jgi:hypothetical protein
MSEHDEQAAVVQYLYRAYPDLLFWATPNGAQLAGNVGQRAARMNKLKAEGFLPGVSDLILFAPRGGYSAMFLEMKDIPGKGGQPTQGQYDFLEQVARFGGYGTVAWGFEQAREKIDEYMSW